MADNVAVTAGSGTTIATDERSIGGSNVQIQRVYDIGGSSAAAGQVTVTNTSTSIRSADETRKRLVLVNQQTVPVYIDPSGGTAATTHFRLDPGASVTLYVTCAVTGITSAAYTASGDDKVHYIAELS